MLYLCPSDTIYMHMRPSDYHACISTCVLMLMYMYSYTYICLYIYIYIHVLLYIYIYIYIYTYIHTYIHTCYAESSAHICVLIIFTTIYAFFFYHYLHCTNLFSLPYMCTEVYFDQAMSQMPWYTCVLHGLYTHTYVRPTPLCICTEVYFDQVMSQMLAQSYAEEFNLRQCQATNLRTPS